MNSNNVLQKVRMMVFGFLMLFILNPISVSANGVSDAIQKVVNVYPNSCSYFTSDGKSDSNSSDSRCSLVNIPSRGGLPSGKTVKDAKGGNAWSCHGFAEYVWYVVFGHCTNTQAKKISASELKVGDFIRFTGHSAIYLGENGNYYYVYDSNWASPADNKVRYNHTISKSRGIEYCYRATNYDSVANDSPALAIKNPTIVGTYWGNMTDITFRPVVIINNPETVEKVRFAVWTTGDQSDLKWYDANYNGIGGYFKDIDFTDFANKLYICHVYVYGYNGNVQSVEMERLDNYDYSKPSIRGVYWGNATDTTFRPVVAISNPTSIRSVRFAVWSTSDQGDLKWYDANYNGAGDYFKDIEYGSFVSQHYFCHIYIYGNDGSTQAIALNDFDTYNAEGNFETVTGGVGCVSIRGWAFDRSNKNESVYIHCYAKDSAGKATLIGITLANLERPDVNNAYSVGNNHGFSEKFITSLSGTYTIEASAINIGGGKVVTFLGAKTVTITQPTIYFDSCGGNECTPRNVINMEHYGVLPNTSRSGYIFDGWYTEKEDGEKVEEDDIIMLTNDQTLYAHWTKKCEHMNVEVKNSNKPSCIEKGYTGDIYCKDCGIKLSAGTTIAKTDHIWDAGKITKVATCTESGTKTYTCTNCNTTKTEEIPATGNHQNTELRNVKEATCAQEGYTGDTYCKDCGTKLSSGTAIAKTDHTWDSGKVTKAATCTESGTKTYTCTSCNTTKTEEIPATGNHQNTELRNVKEATCAQEGYTGDTYCKDCGTKLASGKIIAKTDHIWDTGRITKAATCKESGTKTYTCTSCNTTKTEEIPATGNHQNTELRNVKEATCTEEGYTGDTYCKDCGTKLSSGETIAKTEHTWDSGKITKAATCKESGIKTYTCTNCNTTKTEEIPATGNHQNMELRNEKVATCTEEGYTGDTYCKDCGTKLSSGTMIAKTTHTWDSGKITKAATCKEPGTKTYTCTSCNTTKTEEIPATGNHQNTELRNVKAATCTEEGYTGDTYCKDCGMKLSSGETIGKTDHTWDSGKILKAATCKEAGIKTYTCTSCNTTRLEEIPATGNHQNTELRNVKEATCAQEGYTGDTYCKDCGEKLSSGKTIAKTDHIWDSGRITKPATDTESGIKTYTCINCNTTRTEEIPATGEHLNTELRGAKSATCLEEGYTGDTYCKDCGTKLSSGTVIPKTGHIWDEGVVTKATTCAEKGIRTYTCSICESTKIEEIPSTGHGTKITKFAKEATYTQEGYTGDIYCQDCGTLLEEGKVLAKLEQPKQTVTPGEMIGDKASNGVYKVLADGRSVEFVRQIVQSKAVKIPDTVSINGTIYAVTGISANAFKNNQLLRTTVIGRNVRRIGKQAFYNCKNLRTITIRTSMLTKKNIGTKAFKGTYKKIKVKVPAKQFKTYKKFFKSKGMSTKAIYKK